MSLPANNISTPNVPSAPAIYPAAAFLTAHTRRPSTEQPSAQQPSAEQPSGSIQSRITGASGRAPVRLLLVTAMAGASNCAASLEHLLRCAVDTAADRHQGLAALRRERYSAVIVDEAIAASDGNDSLRKHGGLVIEVNFAICGSARLAREVRTAISQREQQQTAATNSARSALRNELRTSIAGLLLQSQLALSEPAVTPELAVRLKLLSQLANNLRIQLEPHSD